MNFRILNELPPEKALENQYLQQQKTKIEKKIDQGKTSKPSNQKMRDVNKV